MLSWGSAVHGQLGLGGIEETLISSPRFNKHIGLCEVLDMGCGLKHTVVLLEGGRLVSCGNNEKGQLGQDKSVTRPGEITGIAGEVCHVSCGHAHSLALDRQGKVYSWGDGQYGQLGLGMATMESKFTPRPVKVLKDGHIVQICCGGNHCLALTQDCQVFAWGLNTQHQLALTTEDNSLGTPTLVPSLSTLPVVQLSAGRSHSVALTRGGAVFAWGRNNFGQLGIGTTDVAKVPTQVTGLEAEVIRHVACGDEHTVLLTESGKVYTCGSSSHGQLGHGNTTNLSTPTLVKALAKKEVWQITCGRMHTVMVVGPRSEIYTCGVSTSGQLGTGQKKDLHIPTLISLPDPPMNFQPLMGDVGTRMDLGTSVDPEPFEGGVVEEKRGFGVRYRLKRVFAGGDQTFAAVATTQEDKTEMEVLVITHSHSTTSPKSPSVSTSSSAQLTPAISESSSITAALTSDQSALTSDLSKYIDPSASSSSSSPPHSSPSPTPELSEGASLLVDQRILDVTRIPFFLTRSLIAQPLGLDKYYGMDMAEALKRCEVVFCSAGCINGSLLIKDKICGKDRPSVDIIEALSLFKILRQRLRPDDAESKTRLIFHMLSQQPMDELPCDSNLEMLLINKVLPNLPAHPIGLESLRLFYILPAYMLQPARQELIRAYMKKFLDLDKKKMKIILDWFYNGPVDYVVLFVVSLKKMLHRPAFRLKDRNLKHFIEETKKDQDLIKTAFRFLRVLHEVNTERNEPISFDQWHYPYLTDMINIQEDFFDWIENKGSEMIVLCDFPFVLDVRAKSLLMQVECILRMRMAVTHAYSQNLHSLFTGEGFPDMSPDSFVLMVDRRNIVDSTVIQLIRSDEENFKKPLKIQFIGEEGKDEGGMAKEFFMLLSQRILNPDIGMFVEDEESRLVWFRDGETLFYEKLDYYVIIGILCGLAIYNSITVYLPFPIALYKKLLDRPPSFEDFKEMFPIVGRSLQSLLDYEEDDFDEKFDLNFTITRHAFGEAQVKELMEGGAGTPVTKANRRKYIYLYMRYYLIDSISEQFKAFKSGFIRVCAGKILNMLHPRELMSLVVGMQVHDWDSMKTHTQYGNGYSKDHETIIIFWQVFDSFSDELKKKYLIFLTGTDRIPVHGFERMGLLIQRMDGGAGFENLPVAHTCFNILDLPPYPSKEKMKDKLLQAINFTSGFGII